MKKLVLALVATLGIGSSAAAQDSIIGVWQTEVDGGLFAHILMQPCGSAVCGIVQRTFNADGSEFSSPDIGKQIVTNMVSNGDGSYDGQVYRPSDGKTYIGKMTVRGSTLEVKGCVLGGMLCESQNWVRAG